MENAEFENDDTETMVSLLQRRFKKPASSTMICCFCFPPMGQHGNNTALVHGTALIAAVGFLISEMMSGDAYGGRCVRTSNLMWGDSHIKR
jgi:hypothetical protein